jgi:hypothetical protein
MLHPRPTFYPLETFGRGGRSVSDTRSSRSATRQRPPLNFLEAFFAFFFTAR